MNPVKSNSSQSTPSNVPLSETQTDAESEAPARESFANTASRGLSGGALHHLVELESVG
jgi:hypothetical protein